MNEKYFSQTRLMDIMSQIRLEKKTIVFTNGCFDILHIGHLRSLQAARALGDVLVVGLNTDESIRRLKGESRPVNCELERAELLAGLACVDYIVPLACADPTKLIQCIRPDIHVKGGDYRAEDLPSTLIVEQYGGRVVIIPITVKTSTTQIIDRIKRKVGN